MCLQFSSSIHDPFWVGHIGSLNFFSFSFDTNIHAYSPVWAGCEPEVFLKMGVAKRNIDSSWWILRICFLLRKLSRWDISSCACLYVIEQRKQQSMATQYTPKSVIVAALVAMPPVLAATCLVLSSLNAITVWLRLTAINFHSFRNDFLFISFYDPVVQAQWRKLGTILCEASSWNISTHPVSHQDTTGSSRLAAAQSKQHIWNILMKSLLLYIKLVYKWFLKTRLEIQSQ